MKALVLIDFQNEWIDENSPYFVWNIDSIIRRVNKLLDFCRKNGYKIILTKHIEIDSDYSFSKWSHNSQLIKGLKIEKCDTIIEKNKISPFYKTKMEKILVDVEDVVVCGILTNLCVRSFVEWAYDRELNITLIKDCSASFNKQIQNFTLKDIKETREETKILNLKDFLN